MSLYPAEYRCPECQRDFYARDPWGYVRNGKKYCSYSCLRAHDRKAKTAARKWKLDKNDKAEVVRMLKDGISAKEIAKKYRITVYAVRYYERKAEA